MNLVKHLQKTTHAHACTYAYRFLAHMSKKRHVWWFTLSRHLIVRHTMFLMVISMVKFIFYNSNQVSVKITI